MVPSLTPAGRSFRGAGAYYLHDKKADTSERVAWTHTENLPTDDPDKALKVMAWTAKHQQDLKRIHGGSLVGRKLQKPVFAFSVAWHPDESPDRAHMLAAAKEAVATLGMSDHQAVYVSHSDQAHEHVHVILCRVHPETGKAATLSHSRRKVQAWALDYERRHGRIRCDRRRQNAESRRQLREERAAGKTTGKTGPRVGSGDPVIAAAWAAADGGKAFAAALRAEGYELARGRKRPVVVDRWGKVHNPVRHLPGVRAKEFAARIEDLDDDALRPAEVVQAEKQRAINASGEARRAFNAAGTPPAGIPTTPTLSPEFRAVSRLNEDQQKRLERIAADRKRRDKERRDLEEKHRTQRKEDRERLSKQHQLDRHAKHVKSREDQLRGANALDKLTGKKATMEQRLREAKEKQAGAQKKAQQQLALYEGRRQEELRTLTERHEEEERQSLGGRDGDVSGRGGKTTGGFHVAAGGGAARNGGKVHSDVAKESAEEGPDKKDRTPEVASPAPILTEQEVEDALDKFKGDLDVDRQDLESKFIAQEEDTREEIRQRTGGRLSDAEIENHPEMESLRDILNQTRVDDDQRTAERLKEREAELRRQGRDTDDGGGGKGQADDYNFDFTPPGR